MKYGSLILNKSDFVVLKRLLNFHKHYTDYAHKEAMGRLQYDVENALVFDNEKIPEDVVRLYSTVTLVSLDGWKKTFQIVLPKEENLSKNKVSIKSILGSAVIGQSQGDSVQVGFPMDTKTLKIIKVENKMKHKERNHLEVEL